MWLKKKEGGEKGGTRSCSFLANWPVTAVWLLFHAISLSKRLALKAQCIKFKRHNQAAQISHRRHGSVEGGQRARRRDGDPKQVGSHSGRRRDVVKGGGTRCEESVVVVCLAQPGHWNKTINRTASDQWRKFWSWGNLWSWALAMHDQSRAFSGCGGIHRQELFVDTQWTKAFVFRHWNKIELSLIVS